MYPIFEHFSKLFKEHSFKLYMIGGTSRDHLLGIVPNDFDFVTDASPDEMKSFLEGDYTFIRFGVVKVKFNNIHADIVSMRKESDYKDYRHPKNVTYVKTIIEDYLRRDFTINAIYIDLEGNIIDPSGGLLDLKDGIIRFIGDPETRIKEDPLRILRAERFSKKLKFKIDEKTSVAIERNRELLNKLNPDKINMELKKV